MVNETSWYTWVGLSDLVTEGIYMWENGENQLTGTDNWNDNEPDNYAGMEDCVLINVNGKWIDNNCNNERYFICQKGN